MSTNSSLPVISIVTPTYNAACYLEQTLRSVSDQEYPRLEYVVVDGGSTDGTLDIIRSHDGLISRWISEPDEGISDAFNKGVRMATGEIVGIINADDYYHPGALAAVAQAAQDHPAADIYYGDAIHERFDGGGAFRFRPKRDIGKYIWRRMPVSHPATFVRRSAYERYGLFDLRYELAMDYDLMLRMYRGGARFCYVDAILSHYRYGRPCGVKGMRESRDIAVVNGLSPLVAGLRYGEGVIKAWLKRMFVAITS